MKGAAIIKLRSRWQDFAVRALFDGLRCQWSSGSVLWQLLPSDASSYNQPVCTENSILAMKIPLYDDAWLISSSNW